MRWKMCRWRTVPIHSLAVSISMSYRFQTLSQARWWLLRSSAKLAALATARRASWPLSEIRAVTRGIERDDLLDCHRLPLLSWTVRSWATNPGSSTPAIHFDDHPVAQQPGAGGECDLYLRLVSLDLQIDRFLVDFSLTQGRQVLAVQVAVALHAGVDDPAIQPGADLDAVRPVLSRELGLQAGQVLVLTANEPALHHLVRPLGVLPGEPAGECAVLHVEFEGGLL